MQSLNRDLTIKVNANLFGQWPMAQRFAAALGGGGGALRFMVSGSSMPILFLSISTDLG
jgi:hypothetical protein